MKKILVSAFHPGSANSLVSVIRELKNQGKCEVVILAHLFSQKIFRDFGFRSRTINDYNFSELSTECIDKILDFEMPDLVLTGTSNQNIKHKIVIEQLLNLAARRKGIACLSLLDFWGCYQDKFSDVFTNEKFKYLPDNIAIMDELAKEEMIKEGFSPNMLIITGNPHFDRLKEIKESFTEEDFRRVRKDLGIGEDKRMIVYGTQPVSQYYSDKIGYSKESVINELLDNLEAVKLENFELLIKVHPRDDLDFYVDISKRCSFPIIINMNYPIIDTILASDLVISIFSTILIEAAILDKTGISLQPGLLDSGMEDMLITNKIGMTIPVYEKGKVGEIIKESMNGEMHFEKERSFYIDGNSTNRVLTLIDNMMQH